MPISVAELLSRGVQVPLLYERMFWHLQRHPLEAFTALELAHETGLIPSVVKEGRRFFLETCLVAADVQETLTDWARRGLITQRFLVDNDQTVTAWFAANPEETRGTS